MPLELWRASSLQQETKTVLAAYERCLASGDMEGLATLRNAIERRIDELEAFNTAHYDDERAALFDKQAKKLRKLLHEYDAAVASLSGTSLPSNTTSPLRSSSASSLYNDYNTNDLGNSTNGSNNNNVTTRQINENSRLKLEELLAWYNQIGYQDFTGLNSDLIDNIFRSITRTNIDGRMSIRDLRQWYISYGKPAIKAGVPIDPTSLVPIAMVKPSTVAIKEATNKRALPSVNKGLYSWEDGNTSSLSTSQLNSSNSNNNILPSTASTQPIGLPNAMVEFQVRMTAEEYRVMSLRRRQYESELKFKERIEKAHNGPHAFKHTRTREEEEAKLSTLRETPFTEVTAPTSYLYRAPNN